VAAAPGTRHRLSSSPRRSTALATWWTFATVTWARRLVSLHGLRADRPHLSLTGVVVEVQEVGSVQETGRTPIEGTDRA